MAKDEEIEKIPGIIVDDREVIEKMVAEGSGDDLAVVPVTVSMYEDDYEWALSICTSLSSHSDPIVRGNAILGFGHLARRFRKMSERVVPILLPALSDSDRHVSGHAYSACGDISFFTDWGIEGFQVSTRNRKVYPIASEN